jgi:uncharacterized protein (TIRG00374 family)
MASAPKQTNRKWVVLSMVAGLAVFAFYLYSVAGVNDMIRIFEGINPYYYLLGFVAVLLSVFCYSLTWNSLLSGLQVRISYWRTFVFSWVGMFVDEVIPGGISGDFFKAYLISKDSELDVGKIVASVVVQKLFTVAIVTVNLVAGLVLLTSNYGLRPEFLILAVISISLLSALFIALVYFSVKPKATERVVGWIARIISVVRRKNWDKIRFQESARKTLGPFHEGVQSIRGNSRTLIKAAVFSSLASVFDILLIFLVFSAARYPVPVDKALIVYALTVSLQASGVAVVGFTEVVMISLYSALGVPVALSSVITLLARFASLWFKLSIAFVSFQCVVFNRCVCSVCNRVSFRHAHMVPEQACAKRIPPKTE